MWIRRQALSSRCKNSLNDISSSVIRKAIFFCLQMLSHCILYHYTEAFLHLLHIWKLPDLDALDAKQTLIFKCPKHFQAPS